MRPLRILIASAALGLALRAGAAGDAPKPARKAPERKVLRLEELRVEGRVQKPQAVFLLPRANPAVGELDPQESLLPKITRAAEKEPF